MRRVRTAVLGLLLTVSPLFGGEDKQCLDLSAQQDRDMNSPSGIMVIVNGYNRCSEDVDGNRSRFTITALGPGGNALATQRGRFGGSVKPYSRVETRVFVVCDPERVRSIKAEAD
jgi:hypothetical protein